MIEIALQKLQLKEINNVTFQVADIMDDKVAINQYSVILALSVLHLTDDVSKSLKKINDLTSKNGHLISITPCLDNRNYIFKTLIKLLQKIGVAPKIQSLTYKQLASLIEKNGFNIVESKVWDAKKGLYWVVAKAGRNV